MFLQSQPVKKKIKLRLFMLCSIVNDSDSWLATENKLMEKNLTWNVEIEMAIIL